MTYHAELAPRRGRPWLIAMPLIFVLVLGGGVERRVVLRGGRGRDAHQRLAGAAGARPGGSFACGTQAVGGFPFRIEVRCADVGVELKDAKPPIAIKLKEILVVARCGSRNC